MDREDIELALEVGCIVVHNDETRSRRVRKIERYSEDSWDVFILGQYNEWQMFDNVGKDSVVELLDLADEVYTFAFRRRVVNG